MQMLGLLALDLSSLETFPSVYKSCASPELWILFFVVDVCLFSSSVTLPFSPCILFLCADEKWRVPSGERAS